MDTQSSPWLQPMNPGVSPVAPGAVDGSIAAGNAIQRGVGSLSADLLDAIKTHKQNVQDSADVDTTFKMLVPQMAKAGVAPDPGVLSKFASSSLSAKKGMIGALATSYATALKQKTDQAQIGELQARSQYYGDVGAARQQGVQDQTDQAMGLARWAQSMDQQVNGGNPNDPNTAALFKQFSPADRANLHAVAGMGASNPRMAASVIKPLFDKFTAGGNANAPAGPTIMPIKDAQGNTRSVLFDPQTGKTQVLPDAGGKKSAPGDGPRVSKDGKFYEDTATGSWKPLSQNPAAALMGQLPGQPGAGSPGQGAPAGAAAQVPQDYIDYLVQHPETAASFDLRYGEGASAQYLNGGGGN